MHRDRNGIADGRLLGQVLAGPGRSHPACRLATQSGSGARCAWKWRQTATLALHVKVPGAPAVSAILPAPWNTRLAQRVEPRDGVAVKALCRSRVKEWCSDKRARVVVVPTDAAVIHARRRANGARQLERGERELHVGQVIRA